MGRVDADVDVEAAGWVCGGPEAGGGGAFEGSEDAVELEEQSLFIDTFESSQD